ncbi:hypothetical protein K439DRAFT_1660588 [Ramaria rubella]|nr:hypothetical protein K439DRAFT_1660588 [Ramaria rubella]
MELEVVLRSANSEQTSSPGQLPQSPHMARVHKRQRLHTDGPEENLSTNGVNCFPKLPLEMLAEILSYTTSPDILALSRTSRLLCATLATNPSALFIWKDARRRFQPSPIPDPAPNWTESSYIAFLFDPAPCEVTRHVKESYGALRIPSFYVRASATCGLELIPTTGIFRPGMAAHVAAVQSWLPCHEENLSVNGLMYKMYKKSDWETALQQHKHSVNDPHVYSCIQQEYAKKALRLPLIMQYAEALRSWGEKYELWRSDIYYHNITFLRKKAKAENWNLQDFGNTPLFRSLRKRANACGEKLTDEDYNLLHDEFKAQVANFHQIRVRRLTEDAARANREEIRKYWNRLNTVGKRPIPSYSEFRRLDMVRTLVKKNTDGATVFQQKKESVRDELRTNQATTEHIEQQINAWLINNKNRLSKKLGYDHPELAEASAFLHPVDRVTAWFRCKRCNRVGKKAEQNKSLTFADLCAHRCLAVTKKEKVKGEWNVDWFEPDEKAIDAAKKLVHVCNLDERKATLKDLYASSRKIVCRSCSSPTTMPASSVIGHCKRHENLTLQLAPSEVDSDSTSVELGLVAKLIGFSKSGQRQRHEKNFICRHCENHKAFTFDGLRSHAKANLLRHGINDVRDEDLMKKPSNTPANN